MRVAIDVLSFIVYEVGAISSSQTFPSLLISGETISPSGVSSVHIRIAVNPALQMSDILMALGLVHKAFHYSFGIV